MSSSNSSYDVTAQQLCYAVLAGELSIDEFYRRWPSDLAIDDFGQLLYDDLEDAIQHTPGTWFAGKVDQKEWIKTWEYFVVYIDWLLVKSPINAKRRIEIRDELLKAKRMPIEAAESYVAKMIAKDAQLM